VRKSFAVGLTAEAEIIALIEATKDVVYLHKLLAGAVTLLQLRRNDEQRMRSYLPQASLGACPSAMPFAQQNQANGYGGYRRV